MARTCTICSHESRAEIEKALVRRVAFRDIARQFDVSRAAASRHAQEHLPDKLRLAEEAEQREQAQQLLYDLDKLQAHTLKVMRQAEMAGPEFMGLVLRAIGEQRRNLELKFKVADWREIEERLDALEEAQQDGD